MLTGQQISGTFTALVTPFSLDGESVDGNALDALVDAQIEGGVSGLVPCGTTGESPTLSDAEQIEVVRRVVARAKGRVPVVAGTGSFSTKKTIAASKAAREVGADAVMIVMPYYSKPSQDGLHAHIVEVARAVDAPIILYNVPGRTVIDLLPETTERICNDAPNVVGMKEATGNVLRCQELKRRLGDRLAVLSGDDVLTLPMMAVGATGVISVTSNVRPRETSLVVTQAASGRFDLAKATHLALLELHGALFVEPNPAPAKAVLAHEKRMNATVRRPLVEATASLTERLVAVVSGVDKANLR